MMRAYYFRPSSRYFFLPSHRKPKQTFRPPELKPPVSGPGDSTHPSIMNNSFSLFSAHPILSSRTLLCSSVRSFKRRTKQGNASGSNELNSYKEFAFWIRMSESCRLVEKYKDWIKEIEQSILTFIFLQTKVKFIIIHYITNYKIFLIPIIYSYTTLQIAIFLTILK